MATVIIKGIAYNVIGSEEPQSCMRGVARVLFVQRPRATKASMVYEYMNGSLEIIVTV